MDHPLHQHHPHGEAMRILQWMSYAFKSGFSRILEELENDKQIFLSRKMV